MAYEPEETSRDRLTQIVGQPKKTRTSGERSSVSELRNILGSSSIKEISRAGLTDPVAPIGAQYKWSNERYIKENTPWYLKAMTVGPVGGFLSTIQKPLAFTTSALKETIDVFTGQDASWGDFKRQFDDDYTFGRLLHDYDVMQDRDSGWQKFGAAALGFIGDVALDPLSYLGLVGKGIAFGSQLAKGGARTAAREIVRKSALTNLGKTVGDEGVGYVARQMDNANWSALADDIAQDVALGGKSSLKKVDDGWEWTSRTAMQEIGEDAQSLIVKFTDQEVSDIERLYKIGARAVDKGATAVDGDDLRFAAAKYADSGLDRAGRSQVDAGFQGAWFTADDAAKMKLKFGLKVPGTGPIGRALKIANPIERAMNKVYRKGVQAPVGIRIMTSETPVLGKLVTGIPQGLRNGIIKQATGATSKKLQRGGLVRLVGKGRLFAGRLPELKNAIRGSSDAVFVHQGKRVIHATARGNSKGRSTKVQLSRIANDFLKEVRDSGEDTQAMFYALTGDPNAVAAVDGDLLKKGKETFELLRQEANRAGAAGTDRDWLSFIDNYAPRMLTDEAAAAIQEIWSGTGKYNKRIHRTRGKYQPTGSEIKRKYVDPDEMEDAIKARAKSDNITPAKARKLLEKEGHIADKFWGEKLNKAGTPIDGDPEGRVWGSVEKQITEIIERQGGDYSLFVDDIERAMHGYVNQISKRAGEVYTENLLFNEGILIDRMAEFVKLPSSAAVQAGKRFRDSQAAWMNATSNLMEAINRKSAGVGDPTVLDKNVDELQAVVDQAERELLEADAVQQRWADEITRQEENYVAIQTERTGLDDQLAAITKEIEDNPNAANIVNLEKERVRLVAKQKDLALDASSFRFAYETLSSGTAQLLHLERAVTSIFETSNNFDLFVRELAGINPADPNAQLTAWAANNELPSFLRQEGDKFIFVGEAGFESDIERLFAQMDGVLQQSDENGIGVWLGVERELDVLAAQPKVKENFLPGGLDFEGYEIGNAAYKIDWSLQRIRLDMEEASKVINDYAEFADDIEMFQIPDPDSVTLAEAGIVRALDEGFNNGMSLEDVLTTPDVMDYLYTYNAGSSFPENASLFDGKEIEEIVEQIDDALGAEIWGYQERIRNLEEAAETAGQPIRLLIQPAGGGDKVPMTIRDAVRLKQSLEIMQTVPNTSQIPAGPVGVSIDDILINGTFLEGPLGTNAGGKYQLGKKVYYVKRYGDETVDGVFVRDGNGRDRVTGEVLSNALYRELGLSAPDSYASKASDGSIYHVAPWVDDLTTVGQSGINPFDARLYTDGNGIQFLADSSVMQTDAIGVPLVEVLTRGLAADILLANWDVLGTGFDNVGVSALNGFTRVDNGGTFFHRAQGALKEAKGHRYVDPEQDIRNMLNEANNEYGFLANALPDGEVTKLLGQQTKELLDMRNRAGGMENFVRRHMPGLTIEEQAPYIDFLETRLEVLAKKFNQPFFPQGSDEMMAGSLASRFLPMESIQEGIDNGTLMQMLHRSDSPFISPALRYGNPDLHWGDKGFLNATFNGYFTPPTSMGNQGKFNYNLVLDTPLGAKNIKVYGLNADAEVRAAALLLEQTTLNPPEVIDAYNTELMNLVAQSRGGYDGVTGIGNNGMGAAASHMFLDQVSRVHDADPNLLKKILRVWEKDADDYVRLKMNTDEYKLADDLDQKRFGEAYRREQREMKESAARIRMAVEMGDVNIPESAYAISPQRGQMIQKLNGMTFEERLRFTVWMTDAAGGGQVARRLDEDELTKFLPNKSKAQADALASVKARETFEDKGWFKTGDIPEMLAIYTAMIDKNLNPRKWAAVVAQNNAHLKVWARGIDRSLNRMHPQGIAISDIEDPSEFIFSQFYETYRRSLTADGYNASVWFNNEPVFSTARPFSQTTDPLDAQHTIWGNMMVTNPLAVHSADVMTTHRNISRIASDMRFNSADLSDAAAQKTGKSFPDDPNMPYEIDPFDEVVIKTAGEQWLDEAEAMDTILAKGTVQAALGETRFVDAGAFLDWWDNQARTLMGPNFNGVGPTAYQIDLMESLAGKRAGLAANLEEVSVVHSEVSREFANAVAEKGRADVNVGMQQWALDSALAQKQGQINRAKETLARLGAPEDVPLDQIPEDLIEVRLAVGALIDNDAEMLRLSLSEFEEGADDWLELVSQFPEGADDLHRIPQREEVLDTVFRSTFKPIGATLQGPEAIVESMLAAETWAARGGAAGFFNKYDKLHNLLRAYMIAKPGFHGRNFMSAVFMNHLAGINWSSYRGFMRAYWKFQEEEALRLGLTDRAKRMRKVMRSRFANPENINPDHVEYIRQLSESGSLGAAGGQVATEYVDTGSKLGGLGTVTIKGKKINLIDAINPMSTRNAPLRLSRNFGMATETFVRGSLGFDTLLKGGTVDDAFDGIMKFHFDYDDLSSFERNVVKRVIPFYTWTRKNMPLMMEMFARKPQVFNRYMSLKKEVESTTEGPPDIYPRWMQRQGAIQLPFKYEGEDMFILPDMPFKAPLELLDPTLVLDDTSVVDRIQIALGTFGTQLTPLVKAPYEWKAKQNLWKDYNFDGGYEVVPRAYTLIPGLMPLLSLADVTAKNEEGDWAMRDYELHSMAQLMPTFTDLRRLFPDEERYQERTLSTWMSFVFGIGLRTNTKYEQEMELISRGYEMRDEIRQEKSLRGARLR